MKIKSWRDLPPLQKATIIVIGIVQVSLLAAALYDLRRRPADQIRGSKKLWMGLVFIDYIGPIAYFLYGRKSEGSCAWGHECGDTCECASDDTCTCECA